MKILIVEDEEMIREGVSDYLTDCGYETIEAADGQEALEKFSSYEVALVYWISRCQAQWLRSHSGDS